jgi:transcription elongation factor Elf1
MAEQTSKKEAAKRPPAEVMFKCRRCGKEKPLSEMRSVTRFLPVLVVCKDCAQELR